MQRRKKKKLMAFLVIVLISSGIYYSDALIKSPGLFNQMQKNDTALANNNTEVDQQQGAANELKHSSSESQSESKPGNTQLNESKSVDESLTANLEQKAGQPIAKIDILKASVILMRKLSPTDIRYLSEAAQKDTYTEEDYERSREIINKLSPDDISMLKKIGKKYGHDLKFLNQDETGV